MNMLAGSSHSFSIALKLKLRVNNPLIKDFVLLQALGKMGSPKPDVGLRSQLEMLQKQVQQQDLTIFPQF